MKKKSLVLPVMQTLQLARGIAVEGKHVVVDINHVRGLSPQPKSTGSDLPINLYVVPVVIKDADGQYTLLQRSVIIEGLVKNADTTRLSVFVVTKLPSESYRQGLLNYMYFVDATRWHYLSPRSDKKKHPAAGGCASPPGTCLEPTCALRSILSDNAIRNSLACFSLGEDKTLSKSALVALFNGRVSESMIDRVQRGLTKKSPDIETSSVEPLTTDIDTSDTVTPISTPSQKFRKRVSNSDPVPVPSSAAQVDLFPFMEAQS
jgi:hypothetical protein